MSLVNEPEEIRLLVTDLEFARAALSREEDAFDSLCSPWNDVISALHEQIRNVVGMRESSLAVIARRMRLAELEQKVADLKSELHKIKEETKK